MKTFKRDYVYLNRLDSAEAVLQQLSSWFADYNEVAPHRGSPDAVSTGIQESKFNLLTCPIS